MFHGSHDNQNVNKLWELISNRRNRAGRDKFSVETSKELCFSLRISLKTKFQNIGYQQKFVNKSLIGKSVISQEK